MNNRICTVNHENIFYEFFSSIYDNQLGDDSDPITEIGSGQVKIHDG